MSATAAHGVSASDAEPVTFELEHFELDGDGRVEVAGRWYGVRGRRFVRPTLTAQDGAGYRALAVLDHKPWSADEGELWTAAFPFDGNKEELAEAELAVAPDIEVPLPAMGADDSTSRPEGTKGPQRRRTSPAQTASLRARLKALERTVADERLRAAELEAQAEDAQAANAQAASALASRDAALGRLEETIAERDEALAAREELVASRDQALAARKELVASRDQALAARDQAVAARDQALAARKKALADRDAAVAARDAALAESEQASAERETLRSERDTIVAERNALFAEWERLRHQVSAGHGLPERDPARAEPARPGPALPDRRHRDRALRKGGMSTGGVSKAAVVSGFARRSGVMATAPELLPRILAACAVLLLLVIFALIVLSS